MKKIDYKLKARLADGIKRDINCAISGLIDIARLVEDSDDSRNQLNELIVQVKNIKFNLNSILKENK